MSSTTCSTVPEGEVAFEPSDCDDVWCRTTVDGRDFHYWSWTRDKDPDPSIHDGLGEYSYMASLTFGTSQQNERGRRSWFVFGLRTESVPMGSATYIGRFRARSFQTSNPAWSLRQDHYGTMRLVANFDMGQLEGHINRVRGSSGGGSTDDWPTSSFRLSNGRIVNGQFTATLTGGDSDSTTSFDESVRGFKGHILGEFYGPNAEQVGGVVTATRDVEGTENDRVLHGFIGARKDGGRLIGVNDSGALGAVVERDRDANTTALLTDSATRILVVSTEDGFTITAGDVHVEFKESDLGANPSDANEYYIREGDSSFAIDESFTRSFTGPRRYEHMDINIWDSREYPSGSNRWTEADYGYLVYGNRTTDMPTSGTAAYAGQARALEFPSDAAVSTSNARVTRHIGDLDLTADFATSRVTGNIANLRSRRGDVSAYTPAQGELSFSATVNGNGFSATDLAGSGALAGYSNGAVQGAFYGPDAAEVGGVLQGPDATGARLLVGSFAGKKR